MGHTYTKTYLLFIQDSNLTEYSVFYLATLILDESVALHRVRLIISN